MEQVIDIRPLKKQMRAELKAARRSMDGQFKSLADSKICNKLLNMWCVREADTVFTYVSTEIEVDTRAFIDRLLAAGKTVAVPKCLNDRGLMAFYVIHSTDDLEKGFFGVDEPKTDICPPAQMTEQSVCIVPAFTFDDEGYRLGYGKGYYDRFLSSFTGKTIGICYHENLTPALIHGKFDKPVEITVTERKIKSNTVRQ